MHKTARFLLTAAFILSSFSPAYAAKLKVVASFSILGDLVSEVAGDNIDLKVLVGSNGDAHEYQPAPADAKALAGANLVFVNGLGFEGWFERLVRSSGYNGQVVVASKGVPTLKSQEDPGEKLHGHNDPHAWQNIANAKVYVVNIRDALIMADKKHADEYRDNTEKYLAQLDALESWVKAEIGKVPAEKRKVISMHDAFQYFAKAYGITFLAPVGISTDAQPSAADIARLEDQIRSQKITAVFLENMTDSRLITQLQQDAGAHIGGTLYSDALSAPGEPAPDYISMFKHNVPELTRGMMQNPN